MEFDKKTPQWQFSAKGVTTAVEGVVIEPLPLSTLSQELLPHLGEFEKRHQLAGLLIHHSEPIILFRLPDSADVQDLTDLAILIWGWPGVCGASLTFSAFFKGT